MASQVVLSLVQDTITKKVEIKVAIKSNQRGGLWSDMLVDADESDLETAVSKAAATLAIHQIVNYKDRHDPDDCARAARRALVDIKQQAGRAHKKVISLPEQLGRNSGG